MSRRFQPRIQPRLARHMAVGRWIATFGVQSLAATRGRSAASLEAELQAAEQAQQAEAAEAEAAEEAAPRGHTWYCRCASPRRCRREQCCSICQHGVCQCCTCYECSAATHRAELEALREYQQRQQRPSWRR